MENQAVMILVVVIYLAFFILWGFYQPGLSLPGAWGRRLKNTMSPPSLNTLR